MTVATAITLKLFRRSEPSLEIDRRTLGEGELTIGREGADWVILDPTRTLSRVHCAFALRDGVLTLRDDSTNGVFTADGERLVRAAPTPIKPGDAVTLGAFAILVERRPPVRLRAVKTVAAAPVVEDALRAGQVMDAFCSGAQIDASLFAGEDTADVMRRLGVVYRQMVLGLADLMNERTRAKSQYGLEWTTVQAADNNPFRWAPPQRVAVDLLQPPQEGFMAGGDAVKSSFDDLRTHHLGLLAGSRAAMTALLDELGPDKIAEALKGQSFLMKNRTAALWTEYAEAHAKACDGIKGWTGSPASHAFREAYDGEPAKPETAKPPPVG